jgi:alkaline phosphatase
MDKEIANDFYSGFIDVAIGGGYPWYDSAKLSQAGYQRFVCTKDSPHKINSSKFIAFYDKSNDVPKVRDGRGDFLTDASMAAIRNLSQNPNGFFLMIEGSQIDWGGHDNDADYVITEALDFDKTIGAIGAWAKENGETLVIVTADHETGGLTMPGYDKTAGRPVSLFSTKDHTGIPVPVFLMITGKSMSTHGSAPPLNFTNPLSSKTFPHHSDVVQISSQTSIFSLQESGIFVDSQGVYAI